MTCVALWPRVLSARTVEAWYIFFMCCLIIIDVGSWQLDAVLCMVVNSKVNMMRMALSMSAGSLRAIVLGNGVFAVVHYAIVLSHVNDPKIAPCAIYWMSEAVLTTWIIASSLIF